MSKKTKKSKQTQPEPLSSPKEEKLFRNLLNTVHQFMNGKSYKPMPLQQLMLRLSLPEQHAPLLEKVLHTLISQGLVEIAHNNFIWKQDRPEVVTGTLRVHPRGFGFLNPENTLQYPEDIFIPKHLTLNAIDGDTVEVIINSEVISEKGPEGKVVTILKRGRTHLAGIITQGSDYGEIVAYAPLLGMSQKVLVQPHPEIHLKTGDRIVMEVVDWGSKETETMTRLSHLIGHISDPGCDIPAAIEEFELRSTFPVHALEEANGMGTQVLRSELSQREDLREEVAFTIDPDTAKDFDDALSLKRDKKGNYHLGVHIADVSHYVRPGTALDKEASQRCNSTYFPGFCVPMLPAELSNNLCSLKPNVNRLTASVLMKFDSTGELISYRIARSLIRSAKRFTYREAKQVLEGKKKSLHAPTLKLMVELCTLLKKKRYERGSIEFAMPELAVIVDQEGIPQKMDYIEYDITHQLVEEFMLKANEVVASHLAKQGKNLTYRVHDVPAEENMRDFSMLARAFGYHLSEIPTSQELQGLFNEALNTPYGQYLATCYIRRMRLAVYSPENIGHYGLGLTHYCHFTSPIRRYVDLVVHRILFGESDDLENLEMISVDCSEQERISARAENSVILLKKLRLLQSLHSHEPHKTYEAVVTRVKPFGLFFEVMDFMIESFLHVSQLEDDYFVFDEGTLSLKGRHTRTAYVSGDRILVMLKEVDLISQETEWYLVGNKQETKNKKVIFKKPPSRLPPKFKKQKSAKKQKKSKRKK